MCLKYALSQLKWLRQFPYIFACQVRAKSTEAFLAIQLACINFAPNQITRLRRFLCLLPYALSQRACLKCALSQRKRFTSAPTQLACLFEAIVRVCTQVRLPNQLDLVEAIVRIRVYIQKRQTTQLYYLRRLSVYIRKSDCLVNSIIWGDFPARTHARADARIQLQACDHALLSLQ